MTDNESPFRSKVSIIIPFYNCKYVGKAITSALQQTYQNIEIIVVDDGSTRYVDKIAPFRNFITYVKKSNGGTATALNEGIRRAAGEYVVWLSSDDEFLPEKVETQLAFMKKQDAQISYTNFSLINGRSRVTMSKCNVSFPNKLAFYKSLKAGCTINGSTIMIKKALFQDVGMFDDSLRYANDYDLWIRMILTYAISFLDQPLTRYRVHRNMGTNNYAAEIEKETLLVQQRYKKSLDDLIAREQGNHGA
ncbi:glycosyltransferase [Radiobacillus sp. PE A8.2]|uniref:glycosyltransferase n=1 Tax=Radiobacillus sp. PE A8.2 TaxID=3380349 RepID=UPI00388EF797